MPSQLEKELMPQMRRVDAEEIKEFASKSFLNTQTVFSNKHYVQMLNPAEIAAILMIYRQQLPELLDGIFNAFAGWAELRLKLAQVFTVLNESDEGQTIVCQILDDVRFCRLMRLAAKQSPPIVTILSGLCHHPDMAERLQGIVLTPPPCVLPPACSATDFMKLLNNEVSTSGYMSQHPRQLNLSTLQRMELGNHFGAEFIRKFLPVIIYPRPGEKVNKQHATYLKFMSCLVAMVKDNFAQTAVDIALAYKEDDLFIQQYFQYLSDAGRSMHSILLGKFTAWLRPGLAQQYQDNLKRFFTGDEQAILTDHLGPHVFDLAQANQAFFYDDYASLILDAAAKNPAIARCLLDTRRSAMVTLQDRIFDENLTHEMHPVQRTRTEAILEHWGEELVELAKVRGESFVRSYKHGLVHAAARDPRLVKLFSEQLALFAEIQDEFFSDTADAREIQLHSQPVLALIVNHRNDLRKKSACLARMAADNVKFSFILFHDEFFKTLFSEQYVDMDAFLLKLRAVHQMLLKIKLIDREGKKLLASSTSVGVSPEDAARLVTLYDKLLEKLVTKLNALKDRHPEQLKTILSLDYLIQAIPQQNRDLYFERYLFHMLDRPHIQENPAICELVGKHPNPDMIRKLIQVTTCLEPAAIASCLVHWTKSQNNRALLSQLLTEGLAYRERTLTLAILASLYDSRIILSDSGLFSSLPWSMLPQQIPIEFLPAVPRDNASGSALAHSQAMLERQKALEAMLASEQQQRLAEQSQSALQSLSQTRMLSEEQRRREALEIHAKQVVQSQKTVIEQERAQKLWLAQQLEQQRQLLTQQRQLLAQESEKTKQKERELEEHKKSAAASMPSANGTSSTSTSTTSVPKAPPPPPKEPPPPPPPPPPPVTPTKTKMSSTKSNTPTAGEPLHDDELKDAVTKTKEQRAADRAAKLARRKAERRHSRQVQKAAELALLEGLDNATTNAFLNELIYLKQSVAAEGTPWYEKNKAFGRTQRREAILAVIRPRLAAFYNKDADVPEEGLSSELTNNISDLIRNVMTDLEIPTLAQPYLQKEAVELLVPNPKLKEEDRKKRLREKLKTLGTEAKPITEEEYRREAELISSYTTILGNGGLESLWREKHGRIKPTVIRRAVLNDITKVVKETTLRKVASEPQVSAKRFFPTAPIVVLVPGLENEQIRHLVANLVTLKSALPGDDKEWPTHKFNKKKDLVLAVVKRHLKKAWKNQPFIDSLKGQPDAVLLMKTRAHFCEAIFNIMTQLKISSDMAGYSQDVRALIGNGDGVTHPSEYYAWKFADSRLEAYKEAYKKSNTTVASPRS